MTVNLRLSGTALKIAVNDWHVPQNRPITTGFELYTAGGPQGSRLEATAGME